METNRNKVIKFLEINGWSSSYVDNYTVCIKDNNVGFDIDDDEIVVIGEVGDIAHFNLDKNVMYTLLGYMIQNRMIALDYKWID